MNSEMKFYSYNFSNEFLVKASKVVILTANNCTVRFFCFQNKRKSFKENYLT